ncbi:hypothetical protein Tco_0289950 [Tanacetum coccineum]
METIQAFLKEYDHIPPEEKCMALLLAEERFLKIKQAVEEEQNQPEVIQELLLKLMNDLQILNGIQPKQEEPAAQSFLLNWNFPMADDEYTIIYRKPKAITPDLPTEEPDNSLSMGDEHLNTILKMEKSSVENLVPIPSDFKGISEDICDVSSCDNDHFYAEFGLINSLLSRDISITSPKIDFLPEKFAGELDVIDPILPGIDEDDFDEEEGAIDNDILQIKDEILREKLLNVNLLIDKIEALKLTPSIPFVLEYPSSSSILVVDNDFLIEEVDTFLVSEDSIPPGIKSDFDSKGDIIFLDNLLNDDPIPEYERFTFDIEPDAPMTIPSHLSFGLFSRILDHFNDPSSPRPPPEPPDVEICFDVEPDTTVKNDFDELNEDECFDPGGEIDVFANVEDDDYFPFTFIIRIFLPYLTYPEVSPLLLSTGSEDTIFDPGIST